MESIRDAGPKDPIHRFGLTLAGQGQNNTRSHRGHRAPSARLMGRSVRVEYAGFAGERLVIPWLNNNPLNLASGLGEARIDYIRILS